ncbi:MAG: MltR family transcriptional regulator [Phycisphaerae bacterium]|nr:MltR family transcriptional regulator [Phycisphaerae bacterium]
MSYKGNLAKFAADSYKMLKTAESDKDRTTAIIMGELASAILMMLLKLKLKKEKTTEQLFENNGPLETFSNRIKFVYAMGLIDKQTFKDLNCIRKIRNEFAHTIQLSFSESPIREWCKELSTFDQNKNVKLPLCDEYSWAVSTLITERVTGFTSGKETPTIEKEK